MEEKPSEKEKRIKTITKLYYTNPRIQEALLNFAKDREVVPRYFENFGKRPDMLQYPSDINGLVTKGATSFHASEELWKNPLDLNPELNFKELNKNREGWDLLIDIDSPFLDYSKIAAQLVSEMFDKYEINYGIKFSGNKGFHIIVSSNAFPKIFDEKKTSEMFPDWPRTICEFLMFKIRRDYNKKISELDIDFEVLAKRTNLKKEELKENICPNCGRKAKKGKIVKFLCNECGSTIERKDAKITRRRLKCLNENCPGILELLKEDNYSYCEHCGMSSYNKFEEKEKRKTIYNKEALAESSVTEFEETLNKRISANLDLVLVASRHLFRMPYSLHEKTALASIVLNKDEIMDFSPKEANPLKIKIKKFLPDDKEGEALRLLRDALEWKKTREKENEKIDNKKYEGLKFKEIDFSKVEEKHFPAPIKKLLNGLNDGRKRGLFVLLTFLKTVNYPPDEINKKVREWNQKNGPPLREGYIKSQIEWHLKQERKILPPNYDNEAFYEDIGILDEKPKSKNPLVDVTKNMKKNDFKK